MVFDTNHLKIIDEGEIELTQNQTTTVDVGAEANDHLLVAYGFASPTPTDDEGVKSKVVWDSGTNTQLVGFEVDASSVDPTINYTVYVVD